MATTSTEPTYARRLRLLLDRLRVEPSEFAARTGLSEGYLSRVLSGERGKGGELPKLQARTAEAYKVPSRFWSAPSDEDAEKALPSQSQQGGDAMGRMIGGQSFGGSVDYRVQLAQLASDRDDPGDMVKAIMRTEAPADADAVWRFRRYLELRDAGGGK